MRRALWEVCKGAYARLLAALKQRLRPLLPAAAGPNPHGAVGAGERKRPSSPSACDGKAA